MNITFHFLEPISLQNRSVLKSFLGSLFKKEKIKSNSLSIVFCSDKYLLKINQTYLQHDYYTDIITFNLSQPGSGVIDGEIYISIDRIRDNAKALQVTIKQELHRVVFHGALHLCGYKDKKPSDIALMRKKEDSYLNSYFK